MYIYSFHELENGSKNSNSSVISVICVLKGGG